MMEIFINPLKLLLLKKDEVPFTCYNNNIKLTNRNIEEVRQILKQKYNN